MKNFQLPKHDIIKFFEDEEAKGNIERAKHKMRARPFTDRFRKMRLIALIGTFLFPAVSVISSLAFLYSFFFGVSGWFYVSVTFSIALLTFLELTKNGLISNALQTFFSNSGKIFVTLIFASFFSVGSFIMSYNGAEMLVENLDKSKENIVINTTSDLKDIETKFDKQIADEQKKIDEINKKAKSQWNGMLTPEQSKRVEIYESKILYFNQQKEKAKDRAFNEKEQQINIAEVKTTYNAWVFKIIAAINELLTILSITFVAFFDFKTVQQNNYLKMFKEQNIVQSEVETKETEEQKHQLVTIEPQAAVELNKTPINLNTSQRNIVTGFANRTKFKNNTSVNNACVSNANVKYANEEKQPGTNAYCLCCNKEYKVKRIDHKFCSKECRMKWHKENKGFDLKLFNKRKVNA